MKKLGLLVLAVLMISLSSCGEDHAEKAKEATNGAAEQVEQKAEEATKAVEEKAEEVKETAKEVAGDVDGKTLFMENGCIACHQMDKKTVGPSVKEIGAGYAGKKDDLAKFLKGEGKAIIDPANFATMQPNLGITKKMNDAQLGALADYFLNAK